MVPAARVELAPHCWDLNLNQARLPIPPRGHRGNPRKRGLEFLPIRGPACKHNPPRTAGQALGQVIIGDLTCGAHSHIIPGPIYGFTFQTKQNHECTQVTQRHVARSRRQGRR